MAERFSWPSFDRFWQIATLLISLAVLGFELFTTVAGLVRAER
jgi:membrane protein YqaA with SNARE-associated domain